MKVMKHSFIHDSAISLSATSTWSHAVKTLHPAYFAMVMATGIVAIASHLLDLSYISHCLTGINVFSFILLWIMTLVRAVVYPKDFYNDLIDHKRGVGYFTMVAGTCVLGSQLITIYALYALAKLFWYVGIILWLCLTYAIFTGLTVKENKPSLAEGINGGWLVAVVAVQSVSILSELVYQEKNVVPEWIHFFALTLWLCGGMLYIWIISLIFYRYTFFQFDPTDLQPPYWINMGAMAISTLAGATIIQSSNGSALLNQLIPFLKGFTILFWATATWWIPMLIILGVWRHLYKKVQIEYNLLFWGAVFPLGMYTVCTYQLARVMDLPFLFIIPKYFIYLSLMAWSLTFIGFSDRILRLFWGGTANKE